MSQFTQGAWAHAPSSPKSRAMLSRKSGRANATPVQNFRVWSAISARRAAASASSISPGAASTTP